MARLVTRRGRMRSEDEQRIQANIVFIEQEVDGADLAPSLYAAQILDSNDKDEIMGGKTRMDRTRLLINILLLRGPSAFEEFLQVLDANGYDHVAFRIRNMASPGASTPQPSRSAEIEITSQRMTHTSSGFTSMYCRMRDSGSRENLLELARCVSAPDCVFLTSSGSEGLNKETATADCPPSTGTDFNHGSKPTRYHQYKDIADGNATNNIGQRTDSGSYRPSVKVGGAKENEQQNNVTQRQRHTSVTSISRDSDDGAGVGREPRSSVSEEDRGGKTMDERLRRIEDAWFILSRRITRVEDRVTSSTNIPEEELHLLKEELNDLKTDTIQQVLELTEENERKALIIERLTSEAVERKARLVEAQERIDSLSKRILSLETEKGRAEEDVKALQGQLREHERQIVEQNDHFSKETLRLRNQVLEQNKRMKDQELVLSDLQEKEREHRQRSEEQEDELRDQRLNMDEQMHQLGLLAQVVHGMAQTGAVHSPANPNNNPMFCISNTLSSSKNTLGSNSHPSGSRNTARSVKRSAPAPIYRGFRKK